MKHFVQVGIGTTPEHGYLRCVAHACVGGEYTREAQLIVREGMRLHDRTEHDDVSASGVRLPCLHVSGTFQGLTSEYIEEGNYAPWHMLSPDTVVEVAAEIHGSDDPDEESIH